MKNHLLLQQFFLVLLTYNISAFSAEPPALQVGDLAPPFSLMYLNGERMFLRDYCGELRFTPNSPHKYPVVLSFFSTTCQPCKVEIKELHLLAEKFHEKVKFFLIAVGEEKDPVYAHITAQKYTIPVLLDQYLIVSGKYGDAQVVPKLVLVDMEGKIRLFKMGYEPKNIKELEELLEQLTQEKGK